MSDKPTPVLRSPRDGPFAWQSKAALRLIRETFDATGNVATALAVYGALCECASNEGAETFRATHSWIAQFAGTSARTVRTHLRHFAEIGLVAISTPPLRASCTYSLLAIGNGCRTLGNGCRAFGKVRNFLELPPYKERERTKKNSLSRRRASPGKEVSDQIPSEPAAKPTHTRNELLDALATVDGSDPDQLTGTAWKSSAAALKQIRAVSTALAPAEITRRAANYRLHFANAAVTAPALAKHWARCDRPPAPVGHPEPATYIIQ